MLIGVVGFIGSGKGTVGDILVRDYGYVADSFARPLKDATSAIFGWDRELLEGKTKLSRARREQSDYFWSEQLGIDKFSPRTAMQLLGTEASRNVFGENIWSASLIKRWTNINKPDTVVTDCRFPDEIATIRNNGGLVLRIKRGPEPKWYQSILAENRGFIDEEDAAKLDQLRVLGQIPHKSETAWIGCSFDEIIYNDGSLEELAENVRKFINGEVQLTLDLDEPTFYY